MKKIKAVIGVLLTSGFFSTIAGGAVHFKYAKLTPTIMVGGIVFIILAGLGFSIINEKKADKK